LQDYRDYYRQRRPLNSINLTNLDPYNSPFWGSRGLSNFNLDWSIKYKMQLFDPD